MSTELFFAHALAGLPVFVIAMGLWWQAAMDRQLDGIADPRFMSWPDGAESARRPEAIHTVQWPELRAPAMATAAR